MNNYSFFFIFGEVKKELGDGGKDYEDNVIWG